jgi:hypothetical protein
MRILRCLPFPVCRAPARLTCDSGFTAPYLTLTNNSIGSAYAARAKQIEPTVPPELHDYIVQEYCKLRQAGEAGECLKSTPRTLLALLRLSTAMVRPYPVSFTACTAAFIICASKNRPG